MSDTRGSYRKFDVRRLDGKDAPGEKHDGCAYFVLDLDHDPHARAAMQAYAEDCVSARPALSQDIKEALRLSRACGVTIGEALSMRWDEPKEPTCP
jgi:hypothetical protein